MPQDPLLDTMRNARERLKQRIDRIGEYHQELPMLQRALEDLDFMISAQEAAPDEAGSRIPETLLAHLEDMTEILEEDQLPPTNPVLIRAVSPSATGTSSNYLMYVDGVSAAYPRVNAVSDWASAVRGDSQKLRERHRRRRTVQSRLSTLDVTLAQLHNNAVEAALTAASGVVPPVESAEAIRELLVRFKGELIRRCQTGQGTKYRRIAQNLAFDPLHSYNIIFDQQEAYDVLHHELSEIAKGRKPVSPDRTAYLLGLVEDHIEIVTAAADPEKIGVHFVE
jgi:hypothetical protein